MTAPGRIAVTTVLRHATADEPTGFLHVVDLAEQRPLATIPMANARHIRHDPNMRGGLRGGRGLAVGGDRLAVAINDRVFVLGPDWSPRQRLEHRWFGGIHDILADEGGLWVTCANADLLLRVSWEGDVLDRWTWRTNASLRGEFGYGWVPAFQPDVDYRDPRQLHFGVFDLVHLNGIARLDGCVVVSLGQIKHPPRIREKALRGRLASVSWSVAPPVVEAVHAWRKWHEERLYRRRASARAPGVLPRPEARSALVRIPLRDGGALDAVGAEVILQHPAPLPNHNVAAVHGVDGRAAWLLNRSGTGHIVALEEGGAVVRSISTPTPQHSFPRGLLDLGGGRFLVGDQAPLALHLVDIAQGRFTETLQLDGRPHEVVYALAPVPDAFAAPPDAIAWD
ncbi:MAG: YncE family protein [Solirubrobacterales bacterium]